MPTEDNAFRKAALAAWEREGFVLGEPVDSAHLAADLNNYYGSIGLHVHVNAVGNVVDTDAQLVFRLEPSIGLLQVHVVGQGHNEWATANSLAAIGHALAEGPPTAHETSAPPKVVPLYTPGNASAEALASIAGSLAKIAVVLERWNYQGTLHTKERK